MNQTFDYIFANYVEREKIENKLELERKCVFCDILRESRIVITKEQIDRMLSILTEEQASLILKEFEKDNQFWY